MLGAIAGDIIGSRFEAHNYKGKDFELFEDVGGRDNSEALLEFWKWLGHACLSDSLGI